MTLLKTRWITMPGMISNEELNRMRWACRRGMLELDLVLEPFVIARYSTLDERDRQRFQRLMGCEDQDLFAWFMRRQRPDDEELGAIVSKVLEFTLTAPGDR
jgi:antitoxin CptB